MYIRILQDQVIYPYTMEQMRRDFPGHSFATNPVQRDWDHYQVYPVEASLAPEHDPIIETVIELIPVKENGVYTQTFSKIRLDIDRAGDNIRKFRDKLLSDSDWTQLPDSPVDKTVWAAYRQELRNISSQQGFPYNVVWPAKPGT